MSDKRIDYDALCPDCGHYETTHAPANSPHFVGCEVCGCERTNFDADGDRGTDSLPNQNAAQ